METTNNIKHTIKLADMDIEIRLNDECKNGHNDFAITATVWTPGKPHTQSNWQMGGCCHEEILKARPDLKPFVALHLSDAKGAPTYAVGNGFYHLKNSSEQVVKDYLRITDSEYRTLYQAEDEHYFNYLLNNCLHIPARWEQEAKEAIGLLEEMTGQKFEDDSTRYQFTPLAPETVALIEERIYAGYYTYTAIIERQNAAKEAKKQKAIALLIAERDKAVVKVDNNFNVKLSVLEAGLPLFSVIYYDHTNEAAFNWSTDKITQEQFDAFMLNVDYSKLPQGIKFKFKE